jgi:hypothetical protein
MKNPMQPADDEDRPLRPKQSKRDYGKPWRRRRSRAVWATRRFTQQHGAGLSLRTAFAAARSVSRNRGRSVDRWGLATEAVVRWTVRRDVELLLANEMSPGVA